MRQKNSAERILRFKLSYKKIPLLKVYERLFCLIISCYRVTKQAFLNLDECT